MFTRRKILLALLEACGGELKKTDMEKLLFAYCMENGKNHYDFFPYQFGCFSFLSYQDKRVLTKQDILAESDSFKLKNQTAFLAQIDPDERERVESFTKQMRKMRGEKLIRFIYMKYPYYAIRSKIKNKILTTEELRSVESSANNDHSVCLMTIGYEGITIDAYINKLIQHNVALVADVRRNPLSMKYGFSKTRFRDYLGRAGIKYEHIPALGIESSQRKNLATENDYKALFKRYESELLPQREKELEYIQKLVKEHARVALTCFEAKATSCHRHKITEHLQSSQKWSIPIKHI